MHTVFETTGRLDLIITRGWISAWECARLEPGSVIVGSSANAGQDGEICLDGNFIGRGSIIVLGSLGDGPACACVRVEGLERESPVDPEPDRGEYLVELLPFEIVYEGCAYTLNALRTVGIGSIISLDAEYPKRLSPQDLPRLSLVVAGKRAGRGRAVVVGESLGLLLDECVLGFLWEGEARSTGAVLKQGKDHLKKGAPKLYDWRRPDCFTKSQLEALEEIHARVLDTLNELMPELGGLELRCVDQMTYEEFLSSVGADYRVLSMQLGGGVREYQRDASPSSCAPLIQPASPAIPLSEEQGRRVAEFNRARMGGAGRRPLLAFSEGAAANVYENGNLLASALKSGWKSVCDINLTKPQAEPTAPMLRAEDAVASPDSGIPARGMIALISCQCAAGWLNLVYAAESLFPVWKALERHGR